MLPDRVSNLGPLTYESGAPSIALRGPACAISDIELSSFTGMVNNPPAKTYGLPLHTGRQTMLYH